MRPRNGARLVTAVLAVAALVAAPWALAAQSDTPSVAILAVDTTERPETTLSVALRRPPALTGTSPPPTAFSVREAGERPEVRVTPPESEQLEVMLLLDTSRGADADMLRSARSAAVELVLGLPLSARVGVVGYGGRPRVAIPPTSDRAAVIAAIGALQVGGQAQLDAAVIAAVDELEPAEAVRRVVVAFGRGVNAGVTDAVERAAAVDLLEDEGIVFYVLDAGEGIAAAPAATLAGQSGGTLFTAPAPSGLTGLADRVVRDLANTFELTYRSDAQGSPTVEVFYDDGLVTAVASRTLRLGGVPEAGPEASEPVAPARLPQVPAQQPADADSTPLLLFGLVVTLFALAFAALRALARRWWGLWWRVPTALRARRRGPDPARRGPTWAGSLAPADAVPAARLEEPAGAVPAVDAEGPVAAGAGGRVPEPVSATVGAPPQREAGRGHRDADVELPAAPGRDDAERVPATLAGPVTALSGRPEPAPVWLDADRDEPDSSLAEVPGPDRVFSTVGTGGAGGQQRGLAPARAHGGGRPSKVRPDPIRVVRHGAEVRLDAPVEQTRSRAPAQPPRSRPTGSEPAGTAPAASAGPRSTAPAPPPSRSAAGPVPPPPTAPGPVQPPAAAPAAGIPTLAPPPPTAPGPVQPPAPAAAGIPTLAEALSGAVVRRAWAPTGTIRTLDTDLLVGQSVFDVTQDARDVLVRFSPSGVALHASLGRRGTWHILPAARSRQALPAGTAFVIEVQGWTAVCVDPARCRLLARGEASGASAVPPDA